MSLVILIVLVLGVGAGYLMPADVSGFLDSISTYMLLLLLFSVGIDTGLNKAVFTRIRELGFRILLIPFGVALGSLCGGAVTAFLLSLPAKEGLAISAGLGWYSLSGVLITEAGNDCVFGECASGNADVCHCAVCGKPFELLLRHCAGRGNLYGYHLGHYQQEHEWHDCRACLCERHCVYASGADLGAAVSVKEKNEKNIKNVLTKVFWCGIIVKRTKLCGCGGTGRRARFRF